MAKQSDATQRFEQRWKQAMEQPEVVEAERVDIDLDLSPTAVLNRLRNVDSDLLGRSREEVEGLLDRIRDRLR